MDDLASTVINATGPKAHYRLAQIMPSLVRHLHELIREVNLTVGEFEMGVKLVGTSIPFSYLG